MNRVTTIVAALDEAIHVERVIASAKPLGPVFVIDGGSSDKTLDLAIAAGAIAVEHPWRGYSDQKNWALDSLPFDTDWVLFLDADEWLSEELREEIAAAVASPSFDGYWIPRMNVFLGRLLKHVWWYPDYQLRLFKRGCGRYEDRLVHEHVLLRGEPGFLHKPLMHENRKGIDAFMERHERYAALEAEEIRRTRSGQRSGQRHGRILGTWPERRRALKIKIWYRLPGRPAIRFLWAYVIKRGFLDGREGRVYAQLMAAYEALIDAKLLEAEVRDRRS